MLVLLVAQSLYSGKWRKQSFGAKCAVNWRGLASFVCAALFIHTAHMHRVGARGAAYKRNDTNDILSLRPLVSATVQSVSRGSESSQTLRTCASMWRVSHVDFITTSRHAALTAIASSTQTHHSNRQMALARTHMMGAPSGPAEYFLTSCSLFTGAPQIDIILS
jgi:hypothetical protein